MHVWRRSVELAGDAGQSQHAENGEGVDLNHKQVKVSLLYYYTGEWFKERANLWGLLGESG